MIRAKLCVAAEGITRDAETNVLTIFSVLEGMVAAGFPFFIPRIACLVLWERDGDEPNTNVHVRVTLDELVLAEARTLADFQGFRRTRNIVNLNGLLVPRPGVLAIEFALENDARTTARYAVTVEAPPVQAVVAGGN